MRCTNRLPTPTSLAGHHKAVTVQALDFSFCVVQPTSLIWTQVAVVSQITHASAICMLALVRFVSQSFHMYGMTKQWQINRYMGLLVRQGILYFLVYVPIPSHPSTSSNQSPAQLISITASLGIISSTYWASQEGFQPVDGR